MTISLERPALPVGGVQDVTSSQEPHAVVEVRMAVTRDQLAAAVEMGASQSYGTQDPDTLTVEEIRELAAFNLACMGALELEQGARSMVFLAGPDADDLSVQWYIHGIYRAVDRAFPKTA